MNALDPNVLLYTLDRHDPVKLTKARDLLKRLHSGPTATLLLWQVAGEFLSNLRSLQHQGQLPPDAARRYIHLIRRLFPLALPTPRVLDEALDLSSRFSLSHWDSMLLGACIEARVDTLSTEDMGAPTVFGSVRLLNPFV